MSFLYLFCLVFTKKHASRWISFAKLSLCVKECMNEYVCMIPCDGLAYHLRGISAACPEFLGSEFIVTLTRMK